MLGSKNMIKKISLLLPLLLGVSSSAWSYSFSKWQIQGSTFYGLVSDRISRNVGSQFTDAFTSSKNAAYGVSLDFGRYYTDLNSDFVKKHNLGNFTLGGEFIYSYLNSDSEETVVTDTTTYYRTEVSKNSIRLGLFARYYFYNIVYVRLASGLDQTFSSEKQTVADSFTKVKHNILTPYSSIALGYDYNLLASAIKLTYVYGAKKQPSYYTVTVNIGFNYTF